MTRIYYKVYSDFILQNTTSVNIDNIPNPELFNHIEETILKRYPEYNIKFNHVGRTVSIE